MKMRPLLTLLFSLSLTAGPAPAQDTNPLGGPSLPLEVSLVKQVVEGMAPALHVFITLGFKEYALQLPDGFRMQNDAAQGRLLLQRADNSCWVTFRIIKTPPGTSPSSATCRDWLLSEQPNAIITGEKSVHAGNNGGLAFDLEWRTSGFQQSARVAYVPSAVGLLEFKLVSNTSQFGESVNYFKQILASFRLCPNGKRDLPVLSKVS